MQATPELIQQLRDYVSEQEVGGTWTDEKLEGYLTRSSSLYEAAASVWGAKAAGYSGLVNVSESGSSRNLGELQKNALTMSKFYQDKHAASLIPVVTLTAGPIIAPLTRP